MDIVETIHVYYPGSGYSIVNNDYDRLTWYDTTVPKPTKEELLEKWEHVKVKIPWKPLRQERNRRLAEVDWIFNSDYDLSVSDHAVWMAYRKALRDLPSTTEDPANPVWPEKPPLPKGETFTKNVTGEIETASRVVALNEAVRNENIRLRSKITSLERKTTSLEFTLLELKNRVNELET
jgi:hypothetical protein